MTTAPALPSRTTMLRAVRERDAAWDGLFYFAVSTTGVVCRPACPSRRARPEHLAFYPTLAAAHADGFRSCRRCTPEGDIRPAWHEPLLRLVSSEGTARLTDAVLRARGFDPVVIRRWFRRTQGITFHGWVRARRIADAQRQLRKGAQVDQVILASGWESHSGFRDAFSQLVGTPPGRARDGEPVVAAVIDSPLGPLVTAAVDAGLVLLEFGDMDRLARQAPSLQRWFAGPIVPGAHPHLDRLRHELEDYFAGTRRDFSVPLVIRGSPFETRVWQALRRIPYGTTCSYADIAREVDAPKAVRAVGSANGRNRIAIVIPCHRVVNTGGALGGYGGGLWRKKRLLEIESRA